MRPDRPADEGSAPAPPQRLETLACGLWGHVLGPFQGGPARTSQADGPRNAGGGLELPGERGFARCLRCAAWLELGDPNELAWRLARRSATLAPVRGADLRALLLARVAAVWFGLQAIALLLCGLVAVLLARHLPTARAELRGLVAVLNRHTELGHLLTKRLLELQQARPGSLRVVAAALAAGAVLDGAAAVGLWRARRWGALLAILATVGTAAIAVPLLGATTTPAVVAGVDLLVAAWLVWDRRLFLRDFPAPPAARRASRAARAHRAD